MTNICFSKVQVCWFKFEIEEVQICSAAISGSRLTR